MQGPDHPLEVGAATRQQLYALSNGPQRWLSEVPAKAPGISQMRSFVLLQTPAHCCIQAKLISWIIDILQDYQTRSELCRRRWARHLSDRLGNTVLLNNPGHAKQRVGFLFLTKKRQLTWQENLQELCSVQDAEFSVPVRHNKVNVDWSLAWMEHGSFSESSWAFLVWLY